MTRCPKCDVELEVQEADPDVGIMSASAYCDTCDLVVEPDDYEPHETDVAIEPAPRGQQIGTPISQLSGRPGEKGFSEFCRIAKSWGYD